jgi:hypothetical protein
VVFIKNVSIILLTVLIFFTGMIIPIKNASAISFTPSNMAVATKVIRGIGEKLGINWSKGALDAVVGYIAGQAGTDGHEPILPFWWLFGTTPDTIPIDADKSLVRLTPDDFRDGSKEIKKAIDAVIPDTVLPIWGMCAPAVAWQWADKYNGYARINLIFGGKYVTEPLNAFVGEQYFGNSTVSVNILKVSYYSSSINVQYDAMFPNNVVHHSWNTDLQLYQFIGSYIPASIAEVQATGVPGQCGYTVKSTDVVNVTNVNTNIWNTTTNNYNYYPDYPVTIINEGDGSENTDVPVNPPLTPEEVGNIAPPDDDKDGIPNDTDITPGGETPTPDDTGIFAKLFPVLLIVKLFGVLGSCLMYLVRMFQFIMTIPGIDAIPIDNDAFVWFRSAQIVGIKIYDVVSSLAGVGLSFIVFRAIRRAYL